MHSPIEQSEDHLKLLGVITARWATLDLTLSALVGEAIGNRDAGEDIYFSSSAQRLRFDLIRALIQHANWSDDDKTMISRAVEALDGLWTRRNDILHNPAIRQYRGDGRHEYEARSIRPARKVRSAFIPLSLKELEEHAEAVSQHGWRNLGLCLARCD